MPCSCHSESFSLAYKGQSYYQGMPQWENSKASQDLLEAILTTIQTFSENVANFYGHKTIEEFDAIGNPLRDDGVWKRPEHRFGAAVMVLLSYLRWNVPKFKLDETYKRGSNYRTPASVLEWANNVMGMIAVAERRCTVEWTGDPAPATFVEGLQMCRAPVTAYIAYLRTVSAPDSWFTRTVKTLKGGRQRKSSTDTQGSADLHVLLQQLQTMADDDAFCL